MNEPIRAERIEPRWPIAITIVVVEILSALLPQRIRLVPMWVSYVLCVALLLPMVAITVSPRQSVWLRVERLVLPLFLAVTLVGIPVQLFHLMSAMVRRSGEIGGLELFESSIMVWFSNAFAFSLLYWQMDRGGPEARANDAGRRPDWLFPQAGAGEDVAPGWRPTFVDYLFLGYSTATAFSATDSTPLTSRAKLLMMVESTISLATIAVVGARAINILGS
jgi:hypothetical protein